MHTTWRTPVTAAVAVLLTSSALAGAVPALAAGALAAEPDPGTGAATVRLNEVDVAEDWIELVNTGATAVDVSGFVVKDDKDGRTLTIPAGTVLQPGAYLTVDTNVDGDPAGFGLGKADTARVFAADGTTLVDSFSWTQEPTTSYGRCDDGVGAFVVQPETSKGTANRCTVDAADVVVINEVESDGDTSDWIELASTAAVAVDLSGYVLKDSKDAPSIPLPAGSTIAAGGYLAVDTSTTFGLGGDDSARLFAPDGSTLIDAYSWTAHASTTYGRCADAVGDFVTTVAPTKGATNDCAPPASAGALVINEVESNGDDTDWIELMNTGSTPIDLSGYHVRDNDDSRADRIADGTVIQPGALLVLEGETATTPDFTFGLGGADEARIFLPDGSTLVASYGWTTHATVTYGRCPDGTGELTTTTVSTKGLPNDCRVPVRINEVESSGGDPGDWVELVNIGVQTVDLSGYLLGDSEAAHRYPVPAGTTLAAGAYLVLDEADLGFGLGGGDTARLLAPDGATVVDEYTWTAHAATSYGRCPDGTGDFTTTAAVTEGSRNECAGILTPTAWPGGSGVTALDAEGTYAGDLSGIDYEPSGTSAPGTLWAVQNGDGLLYRIVPDGRGGWAPDTTAGWAAGKTLAYPAGTSVAGSVVDAEGVTIVGDSSTGGLYVSAERDGGAASGVSRPSVLRYDVTGTATTLTATQEWNLAADFPGLGANAGLEGITWIPDTFLVAQGFRDTTTAAAYDPADYPGHGTGLFFLGVEGTASVYAYALASDGGFDRVATIATDFALVADVQFYADRAALWVVCDEACDGRTALYEIAQHGADAGTFTTRAVYDRPAGMANLANEGFAVAPQAECVAGTVATFYVDDAATDGHSLRGGTLACDPTGAPVDPVDPTTPVTPADPTPPADPGPTNPTVPGGTDGGTPVASEAMTTATRGGVSAPASATAGRQIAILVGLQHAGETVDLWLHSTPVFLGRVVVGADGYVRVTLPADAPAGAHRIAVVTADGTLIGWDDVAVAAAGGSAARLAATGVDAGAAVATGLALVALGGVLAGAQRVRRRAV
ncbi:MAG TPA: lamin tail domain-containing protein [Cellulomonas sp.]